MADRHRRGVTPGRRDILLVALLGVLVARQVTVEGIKLFGTLGRSVVLPVSLTLHSEQQSIQWSFRKNDSKIRMVQHELHKQHMVSEPYRQRLSYMPNGSINLMNLRYSDDGVYEVLVTRIHGQVEMERISLHIIAPIPRTQIKVSTRVSQSSLSLFCQTEERTELSYWWLKDNKSLPRDGRHILSQENSSLEITNMTVGDCVSYTCVTANQLDHQETRHTLTAEDSPVCPMWSYNYLLSGSAGLLCLGGLCVIICYIRKHQEEALQFIRELCVGRHRWMPNGRGRDGGDFSVYEILELRPLDEPLRAQVIQVAQGRDGKRNGWVEEGSLWRPFHPSFLRSASCPTWMLFNPQIGMPYCLMPVVLVLLSLKDLPLKMLPTFMRIGLFMHKSLMSQQPIMSFLLKASQMQPITIL
ncbi:hepatocyte cell adhesion molecule-like isoform X2 [Polypterus senegalus]|uniref:hepatocyte cell adhesion molecule-like isoform X2 n=1 Tax=Polypterus senegalus TaxID=55291 RepID=UPI00196632B4|nr:hepatocyte cell adhesion molecule-like isoform X2 [Polypterus senegalus]